MQISLPSSIPTFEQDLDKRSINGLVVYIGVWLFIGFATPYREEFPEQFTDGAIFLCFFIVTRITCLLLTDRIMALGKRIWYLLFSLNVLMPAGLFGVTFSFYLLVDQRSETYTYFFMSATAFATGGVVSFYPAFSMAIAYLFSILGPCLLMAFLHPQECGDIGVLAGWYGFFLVLNTKRLHREYHERIAQHKSLVHLSQKDGLTNIYNRRSFDRAFSERWKDYTERQLPNLCLILVDIDHFKQVNDTYGHPVGDVVIQRVATVIEQHCSRDSDLVARLGGEEFAVLLNLPHTAAMEMAERIRCAIAEEAIHIEGHSKPVRVTVSIGLAQIGASPPKSQQAFYQMADAFLYKAKRLGRNRVMAFDSLESNSRTG